MEEAIFRYIDKFGFPIVMCLIWVYTAFKLFSAKEETTKELQRVQTIQHNSMLLAIQRNSDVMDANTKAAKEQTDYLKRFGSDPLKLCKFPPSS
jgi:hypothetical protein